MKVARARCPLMSPITRILAPIFILLERPTEVAEVVAPLALPESHIVYQIILSAILISPALALRSGQEALGSGHELALNMGVQSPARQAVALVLGVSFLARRFAYRVGRSQAPTAYAGLVQAPILTPVPASLLGLVKPRVRPAHVASELEVFWTGRGGSFALSFLALSLSARVLLVFVLFGLG